MQGDGLDTWKTAAGVESWTGEIDREACRDRERLDRRESWNSPESFLPSLPEAAKQQIGLSAWLLWLEIKLSQSCLKMSALCPIVELLLPTHQMPSRLVQIARPWDF